MLRKLYPLYKEPSLQSELCDELLYGMSAEVLSEESIRV